MRCEIRDEEADHSCPTDESEDDTPGAGHRQSPRRPNGWAFSGEPSERSERPERSEGRRVRCNAMLCGGTFIATETLPRQELFEAGASATMLILPFPH